MASILHVFLAKHLLAFCFISHACSMSNPFYPFWFYRPNNTKTNLWDSFGRGLALHNGFDCTGHTQKHQNTYPCPDRESSSKNLCPYCRSVYLPWASRQLWCSWTDPLYLSNEHCFGYITQHVKRLITSFGDLRRCYVSTDIFAILIASDYSLGQR
jgi:hypothetical protein